MNTNQVFPTLLVPKLLGPCLGVATLVYLLFLTISLWSDMRTVFALPFISSGTKAWTVLVLYTHPLSHFSWNTLSAVLGVAILMGLHVALLLYVRSKRREVVAKLSFASSNAISFLLLSLGTGCAACGSALLVGVLGWMGIVASAGVVWWASQILLLLSIAILTYSNYQLYLQAKNPLVCKI